MLSQTSVYFCQTTVEAITVKPDKSVLLQNSRNWSHSSAEKKRPCLLESSEALCPKLSWSRDWCKIILVRKFSRLPLFSEISGTIKNSIALWEMTFHSFYLQCNVQKSNQRIIWINEAVCPSLQRRHSPQHHAHAEEAWWWMEERREPSGWGRGRALHSQMNLWGAASNYRFTPSSSVCCSDCKMSALITQRGYNLTGSNRISLFSDAQVCAHVPCWRVPKYSKMHEGNLLNFSRRWC